MILFSSYLVPAVAVVFLSCPRLLSSDLVPALSCNLFVSLFVRKLLPALSCNFVLLFPTRVDSY